MELRAALREAASVLWPLECAGCGALDVAVCPGCRALLLAGPVRETFDGLPLVAAAEYQGAVRALIVACKEHGARAEARALAAGLSHALAALPGGTAGAVDAAGAVLVRVPSSREGMRRRGFDPVALVVRAAGLRSLALRRAGPAQLGSQKQRGIAERAHAAQGSLVLPASAVRRLAGRPAVLVDDVVTSGATVREAVRAVRAAGCEALGVAAVARTPRRLGQLLA